MTRSICVPFCAASLAVVLSGCVPEFADDGTRIDARRIVAITASPAEVDLRVVTASREVVLEAAVADPNGGEAADVIWTLCLDRKPLSELGPVSERCLTSPELDPTVGVELGRGASVAATLPERACQLFGPERPDPKPGEPAGRPVDPDPTGGFYQPVLAWLDERVVLGAVRMTCGLFNVAPSVSTDFAARYRLNENPTIEALELVRDDGTVLPPSEDGSPTPVRSGESLVVRAVFPACPSEPVCGDGICSSGETASDPLPELLPCPDDCSMPRGCGGAETYVLYDPVTGRVESRRESLVASWYGTAGQFASERTGESQSLGGAGSSETLWTAPTAGQVTLWTVLRDDRGGSSIFQANLRVEN